MDIIIAQLHTWFPVERMPSDKHLPDEKLLRNAMSL